MRASHLICDKVAKDYGGTFALGPMSLEITSGVTCLVGPNGAGKSTLFRLVAGVERASSGTVRLECTGDRDGMGYLPQEPLLPGAASCEDFLYYVAWLQRIPAKRRATAVASALNQVGLATKRASRIRTLSGGMRRRLGIAHALIHDPLLLLLDEPTVGLDPMQRIAIRDTVGSLGEDRVVIVSTHLVEDVRGLADRVIVLNEGSVVYDGDLPGLEKKADPAAPGDTDLERAIAILMGERE